MVREKQNEWIKRKNKQENNTRMEKGSKVEVKIKKERKIQLGDLDVWGERTQQAFTTDDIIPQSTDFVCDSTLLGQIC